MKTGSILHAEAAINSEHAGRERLLTLLSQTATSKVVEAVESDKSPIEKRIPA